MKKVILIILIISAITGCANTKDLATTLRYADNSRIGVDKIQFIELNKMKRGKTCTFNLLYYIPLWGDGSIITAADEGKINNVQLIGETGRWYFPFTTACTIVFGDGNSLPLADK